MTTSDRPKLLAEIEKLRLRLNEAEETLRAIGSGEVDALVVAGSAGERVFTLKGAEHPYRVLVETMNEGAAILAADGTILFCNNCLATMLHVPLERLTGAQFGSYVTPAERLLFSAHLGNGSEEFVKDEFTMMTGTGTPVPTMISFCVSDISGNREIGLAVTDLSQLKRNEEIVASERLARSIIEQAGEAIIVCDKGGRVISASLLAHRLCDQNPLLEPFDESYRLRDAETGESVSVSRTLAGETLHNVEVTQTREGERRNHLILNAAPLKGDDGNIIGCVVTLTDITEQKKAEESLRKSEERYRGLVETAQIAIFINRNNRIEYANPAAFRLFGANGNAEIIGRSPYDFVHPEFHATMRQRIDLLLNGGNVPLAETRIVRVHGDVRSVEVNAVVFADPQGLAIQVMMHDITARKRAEDELKKMNDNLESLVRERTQDLAATLHTLSREMAERRHSEKMLRQSEERYRKVVEDQTETINRLNADGVLTYVNEVFCRVFGKTSDELLGSKWHPRAFSDDVAYIEKQLGTMSSSNPVVLIENRIRSGSGEIRWMQFVNRGFYDEEGRLVEIQAVGRDITERKRAEEELQEAIQFSEQVISSAQEGVIVYDLNLRLRVWNPYMEQISGLSAADLLGKLPYECFPCVKSEITALMEKVLRREVTAPLDFHYLFPKTGRSGWASLLTSPLRNTKGEIVGVISTVREISRRKELEDESRQALEAAKEANNTMLRLMRTIAHEFRTPLGLITGSVDILDRYWDRLTPENRLEQNEHIRNATRQLTCLVNSVVSFQLSEKDRPASPPQVLNIGNVCRAIAEEVEKVWRDRHEFAVSITPECDTAVLDEILFRRILQNLLTNAFRYTPAHGSVSMRVGRKKNRLILEIADSGIGIPEEDQPLIFDAFYRSRNVEGRRGLGLGLSIVREALHLMGGTIRVTSSIGTGTTMRVEIPVVDPLPGAGGAA